MRCVIFGATPISYFSKIKNIVLPSDYIICADGGYDTAVKCGLSPHFCVGDMDSLTTKILSPKTCIATVPTKKDDTDLMLAVKKALSLDLDEIILFGTIGGRFDHSFGNLCVLKYLCENKMNHKLIDEDCEMTMICGQNMQINNKIGHVISVFPFGCHFCTVTYSGLEYPAKSKKLFCNNPIGVSNVIWDKSACVCVESGTALIVVQDRH